MQLAWAEVATRPSFSSRARARILAIVSQLQMTSNDTGFIKARICMKPNHKDQAFSTEARTLCVQSCVRRRQSAECISILFVASRPTNFTQCTNTRLSLRRHRAVKIRFCDHQCFPTRKAAVGRTNQCYAFI